MGFRFQKRIKIAPGVRLNLSKSGASVSLGRNGATVNLSKRGTFATLGLPGTGLSYRTKIGKKRKSNHKTSRAKEDSQAGLFADSAIAKELRLVQQKTKESQRIIDHHEKSVQDLLSGWRSQLVFPSREEYEKAAKVRPFLVPEPHPKKQSRAKLKSRLRQLIRQEILKSNPVPIVFYFVAGVVGFIFALLSSIFLKGFLALALLVVVWGILFAVLSVSIRMWWLSHDDVIVRRQTKKRFPEFVRDYESEFKRELAAYELKIQSAKRSWEQSEAERVEWARLLLEGNQEAVFRSVTDSISDLQFPFESGCDVAISDDGQSIVLNFDLPEIEDSIPLVEYHVKKDGTLGEKKRNASKRNREYLTLVLGLVTLVVATSFSAAPNANQVLLGAFTQRGKSHSDTYIVHVDADRAKLPSKTELKSVEPIRLVSGFSTRAKIGKNERLLMLPRPKWLSSFKTN